MVTLEGEDDACRYYLLDSMRDYAYEKAAASGEASDLIRRHCLWAAEFADRAASAYFSKTYQQWTADIRKELDNIRLALTRALAVESNYPEIVGRIIGGLRSYWFRSVGRGPFFVAIVDELIGTFRLPTHAVVAVSVILKTILRNLNPKHE